jgi:hypothetical protein
VIDWLMALPILISGTVLAYHTGYDRGRDDEILASARRRWTREAPVLGPFEPDAVHDVRKAGPG